MFQEKYISPNFNERRGEEAPFIILLHYTGRPTTEESLAWLSDPEKEVSAHYLIDESGALYNLVPEEKRAWHAGVACWQGYTDINSVSIGIELSNPGHEFGYRPFPAAQMDALAYLCKGIMDRWPIRYVLGHSDVAPERKMDPGELFDWRWLAEQGVGFWPEPTAEDFEAARDITGCEDTLCTLLDAAGYNTQYNLKDVFEAYHHHYGSYSLEDSKNKNDPFCFSVEAAARLLALVRYTHNMHS
jgi:N-acetylmuramoyl-L-alanine amidase